VVTLNIFMVSQFIGKFGRKLCCNFNEGKWCIRLVDGGRHCILGENDGYRGSVLKVVTTEVGNVDVYFCSLFPVPKIVEVMNAFCNGTVEVVQDNVH
jgi:hypothetical protein